ncbi:MAG: ral secretion pathway protein [Candidatus Parcubacteria bacterium]|jgi:general secretion pathway protein F|nr:ral secretion pathway protein [Candidatus Parcubacteria bacterium]
MKKITLSLGRRWKRRDIILFVEGLEMYVSAGLPLDRALQISAEGNPTRRKSSIAAVRSAIESGTTLSRALSQSLGISSTIASLIEYGESSGTLVQALRTARSLLEREDEMIAKCLGAMAYPVAIALFAGALAIALVRGVMPQIIPLLRSLHVPLPLLTRAVIFASDSMINYGIYVVLMIPLAAAGLRIAYERWEAFRKFCHSAMSGLPVVGGFVRRYVLAVFLRSCGALVASGLSSAEAYRRTARAVSVLPLRSRFLSRSNEIERGVPLSMILSTIFSGNKVPRFVEPLVLAGEASGNLGQSLIRAADILDGDIERGLKRLSSLVEPIMMAGMGCVVAAIALSIMLPIYDVSKILQK